MLQICFQNSKIHHQNIFLKLNIFCCTTTLKRIKIAIIIRAWRTINDVDLKEIYRTNQEYCKLVDPEEIDNAINVFKNQEFRVVEITKTVENFFEESKELDSLCKTYFVKPFGRDILSKPANSKSQRTSKSKYSNSKLSISSKSRKSSNSSTSHSSSKSSKSSNSS